MSVQRRTKNVTFLYMWLSLLTLCVDSLSHLQHVDSPSKPAQYSWFNSFSTPTQYLRLSPFAVHCWHSGQVDVAQGWSVVDPIMMRSRPAIQNSSSICNLALVSIMSTDTEPYTNIACEYWKSNVCVCVCVCENWKSNVCVCVCVGGGGGGGGWGVVKLDAG